jgi:hypothetical protein
MSGIDKDACTALREELIQELVKLEWKQFSAVHNADGPISCQSMPQTFALMRRSQATTWDDATLESRLDDFRDAEARSYNLMTEKYARMMEHTHPEEYAAFAALLTPIDAESRALIEDIIALNITWQKELAARYPNLSRCGRALRSSKDKFGTSFETYLRGELMTCSHRTIRLWHAHVRSCHEHGINLGEADLTNQVKGYGYANLEAAELSLKSE